MVDEVKLAEAGKTLAEVVDKVEAGTAELLPLIHQMGKAGFHQVAAIMLNDFAQKFGAVIQQYAQEAAQKKADAAVKPIDGPAAPPPIPPTV